MQKIDMRYEAMQGDMQKLTLAFQSFEAKLQPHVIPSLNPEEDYIPESKSQQPYHQVEDYEVEEPDSPTIALPSGKKDLMIEGPQEDDLYSAGIKRAITAPDYSFLEKDERNFQPEELGRRPRGPAPGLSGNFKPPKPDHEPKPTRRLDPKSQPQPQPPRGQASRRQHPRNQHQPSRRQRRGSRRQRQASQHQPPRRQRQPSWRQPQPQPQRQQ
jgi:hypothetical protein